MAKTENKGKQKVVCPLCKKEFELPVKSEAPKKVPRCPRCNADVVKHKGVTVCCSACNWVKAKE